MDSLKKTRELRCKGMQDSVMTKCYNTKIKLNKITASTSTSLENKTYKF